MEKPGSYNFNNWVYKEATEWSKKEIKRLLTQVVVDDGKIGKCQIFEVESCKGEARVYNIEKTIRSFYEFSIICKWKGKLNGGLLYKIKQKL